MMRSAIRVVGLVPHPHRELARALARDAVTWFGERGVAVRIPPEEAAAVGLSEHGCEPGALLDGLDVAISLGGDGTMLRTVDLVGDSGVAVVGVNVGQMGYLAEVDPAHLGDTFTRLVEGDYDIDERMMLAVTVSSAGEAQGAWSALNEAVVEKSRTGRLARLAVDINGTPFTTYAADGVIVATPTGSTAYSLSARGPIVSPRIRCLLLTPVSPHMLFDRALVLDGTEELRFEVTGDEPVQLTLDGQTRGELAVGDAVTFTAGPHPARIATFGLRDFHQILKAKFGLADR